MAKQALTWTGVIPESDKREREVACFLRTSDPGWGVTESQSAFVYPHTLRPLQKIAGLAVDGAQASRMGVSDLLNEAFPNKVKTTIKSGGDREDDDDGDHSEVSLH